MTSQSPERFARVNALGASTKYDLPERAATVGQSRFRQVVERPALVLAPLCELPGRIVWWYIGALALVGILGAWAGDRAAKRGIGSLQGPTLSRLRARVQVLRSIGLRLTGDVRAEALQHVDAASDELRDLELPPGYHPRRSMRPMSDAERSLGSVERGRRDA